MKVLFGFNGDDKTYKVYWEDDGGCVMCRIRRVDGSSREVKVNCDGLAEVSRHHSGAYSHLYSAEVGDVREAFKYLGKAADLAMTLPEVDLAEPETDQPTS